MTFPDESTKAGTGASDHHICADVKEHFVKTIENQYKRAGWLDRHVCKFPHFPVFKKWEILWGKFGANIGVQAGRQVGLTDRQVAGRQRCSHLLNIRQQDATIVVMVMVMVMVMGF